MSDYKNNDKEDLNIDESSEKRNEIYQNNEERFSDQKFGVQHDKDGNIIKVAENAVPPEAWRNQKKAYNDAWENHKNQVLGDEF